MRATGTRIGEQDAGGGWVRLGRPGLDADESRREPALHPPAGRAAAARRSDQPQLVATDFLN